MNDCSRFDLWIVSDDPVERRQARSHARECAACAAVLRGQQELARETARWRAAPLLPPDLEAKVIDRIDRSATSILSVPRRAAWRPLAAAAIAAALVIGLGWGVYRSRQAALGPEVADRLLIQEAIAAADRAERLHARAIAGLERAALPMIARTNDPHTPPREAAILLAYRDRLAFLDATISEVQELVESNPGNAAMRTTLLAAYKEKSEVLREILALEEIS